MILKWDANDGIEDGEDNLSRLILKDVVNLSVAVISPICGRLVLMLSSPEVAILLLVRQPAAGVTAKSGSTVLLTAGDDSEENEGMVTVPDLRGKRVLLR